MKIGRQNGLVFFFAITSIFSPICALGQLSNHQKSSIDSIFTHWNQKNHPGGVIAIKQHGQWLYHQSFGLANIEHQIPNTTNTLFNIASISKQFTAFGILLLQREGKLSIDEDIREYLDDVPDFGDTITLRHLLHHTSGIRSTHAMLELAGWRGSDPRSQEDVLRFFKNQLSLNFKPGSDYAYCNTGYILLAEIIEAVTNQPFEKWMKQRVFEPLGMPNTYFERDYTTINLNNADSYNGKGVPFNKAIEYWGYVGTGNIHTTATELIHWLANFHESSLEYRELFIQLQTIEPLSDGSTNNYAFGLVIDKYKGAHRIQHGGAVGGYRSYVSVLPDHGLTIVLLSNFSGSSVDHRVEFLTDILLPHLNEGKIKQYSTNPIKLPNSVLKEYEGDYWNEKKHFARRIYVEHDTLWYYRTPNRISALEPLGDHIFNMLGTSKPILIKFAPDEHTMIVGYDSETMGYFKTFDPFDPLAHNIEEYLGRYKSLELETNYTISFQNGFFSAYHSRHGPLYFNMIKRDIAQAQWPLGVIEFHRNLEGEIDGFYVDNGRAKKVWFDKEPP
jgi:CubicO group peptidase (beta-lactamase class C family)